MNQYKRPEKDLENPPGQIVNTAPIPGEIRTLGDYIKNVQEQEAWAKAHYQHDLYPLEEKKNTPR